MLARTHQYRFALVEAEAVDLPVGVRGRAVGREDEGGVVEDPVVTPLGNGPGVQPDPGVAGRVRHLPGRRPVECLRLVREEFVGEGSDRPQFGEDDEIAAPLFPDE